MVIAEHRGKEMLRSNGIAVPEGSIAATPAEAAAAARALGSPVVIKAQVSTGGRGKAGGVAFAGDSEGAEREAARLLGSEIAGYRVTKVLVERRVDAARELYAAIANDAAAKSPVVLFSTEGGVDVERASAASAGSLLQRVVDIRLGFDASDAWVMLEGAALGERVRARVAEVLAELYRQYRALDLELLEINPLALDQEGRLWALDCKLSMDESARVRHRAFADEAERWLGPTGTPLEREAKARGLLYVELDGDVGVLTNGAGLGMATVDAVDFLGGRPANFLEIGGNAYTQAAPALELVLANPRVRSVVVIFCGAFARTDVMTEGVAAAVERLHPAVPMFFSIHGTGQENARALARDRLGVEPFERMDDAVLAAVAAARAQASRAAVS